MLDDTLLSLFNKVGFDDKEARVYLALLELGQGTASEVARLSELKRAIVYHVIERLSQKGYAQEVLGQKVKHFTCADPAKIFQNIRVAVDDFRFMLPMIRALQNKGTRKPRIEFFEGRDGILSTYWTYAQAADARYLTSIERLYEFIPDEVESWVRRYQKGSVKQTGKHFLTDTPKDRQWG